MPKPLVFLSGLGMETRNILPQSGRASLKVMIACFLVGLGVLVVLMAFWNARGQAANQMRIDDVTRIQAALKIYLDENGRFPSGTRVPDGIGDYLDFWPTPPTIATGSCARQTDSYYYSQKSLGDDYTLTFCLGQKTQGIPAGNHTLTSQGLQN